jgi:hypothetical protein
MIRLEEKIAIAAKTHDEFMKALEQLPNVVYKTAEAMKEASVALEKEQEKEVVDFITDFKAMHPAEVEDVFLHGYCYWFAKILEERFEGIIYYMPIDNHFITRIGKEYYDIRGKLNGDEFNPCCPWSEYKHTDSLEVGRIYRDCIYKKRL